MADVPVRFAGLRGTLAAFAVDLFAGRVGSLTDAPMCSGGYDRQGVYDGAAWRLGVASDYAGNANVLSLRVNGTEVIDSAKNVKGTTLWSGGAIRVDANGDGTLRNLQLTGSASAPELRVATPAGSHARLRLMSGPSNRWALARFGDAESGGDAGSDLAVFAYDDNGTMIDVPMRVERKASGKWQINRPLSTSGGLSSWGVAPPSTRPTVRADATDLATALTLINQLRAALIADGTVQ